MLQFSIDPNVLSNGYFDKLEKAFEATDIVNINKNKRSAAGVVNPPKGLFEPDERTFRYGLNARGVRERFYNMSFAILREIAKRVGVVSSIQNVRSMQVRAFSKVSFHDDDVGFRVKLKDKDSTPSSKQKGIMKEIEEFIMYSGYTDFVGADEREDEAPEMIELITREILTIDQVAISLRRNRKGKLLDYWILDGATIKRTMHDTGYMGNKKIKYVQELDAKIVEVFTADDLIFYYMNRVTDIRRRGYGYSFIEMAVDVITAWLYAMTYNKEVFNSSSQPKGVISFEGEKIDQPQLEELQRQWVAMFRGVKGMWKTPFLQYGAKWIPMAPSNRDMEFNQYTQTLASWICAIHGIDAQELGMRLNQAQNVLNENQEAKIAYSKDRGLKFVLTGLSSIYNKIIKKVPEWNDYQFVFTGIEARNQTEALNIEKTQTSFLMTVNEKRAEKDLPPVKGGDIILDPVYIQNLGNIEANEQQQMQGEDGNEDQFQEDEQTSEDDIIDEETNNKKMSKKDEIKLREEELDKLSKSIKEEEFVKIIL